MEIRQTTADAQLTCREIVAALDRHIIGQDDAKRTVAIALRNRWRRMRLPESVRNEVVPNNIVLIGPTGVGKTEIARRLAQIGSLPFLKVEATKFTEKGYVGRDVDSMVRDLVANALGLVRSRKEAEVREELDLAVENRLIDLLFPPLADDVDAYIDLAVTHITRFSVAGIQAVIAGQPVPSYAVALLGKIKPPLIKFGYR